MHAVICDPGDRAGLWAADRLRARLGDVLLVSTGLLALAPFHMTIGSDGAEGDEAAILLPDGRAFGPQTCAGFLNRVAQPPKPALAGADAAYAAEEMVAITLAFLAAFGEPVVNRPDPSALAGRDPGVAQWLRLAVIAGLPTAPFAMGDGPPGPLPPEAARMLVIGDRVLGGPVPHRARVHDLAGLAGLRIMSLSLAADGAVIGGSAMPDLSMAGEAGADALAELIGRLA